MTDIEINESKRKRQQLGANKWKLNNGIGGWKYPTGVGKTYGCIHEIIYHYLVKRPHAVIYVITPTAALHREWKELLDQHHWANVVLVDTVDSYLTNNRVVRSCDLLVLDEPSSYYSDERKKIWDGTLIKFRHLIWLDATPEDRNGRHKEFLKLFPIVDEITEKEAIARGWKTRYVIVNWGINLPPEDREAYDALSEELTVLMNYFDGSMERATKVLKGFTQELEDGTLQSWTGYQCAVAWATKNGWSFDIAKIAHGEIRVSSADKERAEEIDKAWNPNQLIGYAKKLFDVVRSRRHLLLRSPEKVQAAVDLLKKYEGTVTISFSESIDFINNLHVAIKEQIGEVSVPYHGSLSKTPMKIDDQGYYTWIGDYQYDIIRSKSSKNFGQVKSFGKKTLQEAALRDFREGKAWHLNASTSLNKGVNIFNKIKLCIINSQTSNPASFMQRIGRATRLDFDEPDATTLIVVIYFKDTREYSYIRSTQKTNVKTFFVEDIDHVSLEPPKDDDFLL